MKLQNWKLNAIAAVGLMVGAGTAVAESQYGHDSTGASQVSAAATLTVTVNVPKLVLLRVGASGAGPTTATLQGVFGSIPGGALAPLADANEQATGWNGTAPTIASAATATVRAFAWTNSSGGGNLTAATVGAVNLGANVTVTESNALNGGLDHPGTDLTAAQLGTVIPFAKNAVRASDWTYSISGATLTTLDAGAISQVIKYTATTL
ncbi:MAG TPA: hypothetical protein VNB23_04690 [Ramlibacter sp.]|nr:hypothetical protein [Ramlibacter sp.]